MYLTALMRASKSSKRQASARTQLVKASEAHAEKFNRLCANRKGELVCLGVDKNSLKRKRTDPSQNLALRDRPHEFIDDAKLRMCFTNTRLAVMVLPTGSLEHGTAKGFS